MAAASRCAPHARRGSSGGAPGTRLYKPGPQHRASGPTGVRLSVPGGTLSCCLSPQRAESAEPERSEGPGAPGPPSSPTCAGRATAPRPPTRPATRPEPLPQVAVGAVLVVVLRLRVPEQHGWSSRPHERRAAPTQAAPTSHGHLEEPLRTRCRPAPRLYGRPRGRGWPNPAPRPCLRTWRDRTRAPFPGAKAPPVRPSDRRGRPPERPEGAARPRSPRVGLR